jgi:hypothetical protein
LAENAALATVVNVMIAITSASTQNTLFFSFIGTHSFRIAEMANYFAICERKL